MNKTDNITSEESEPLGLLVIYEKIMKLQEDVELLTNQLKTMNDVLFFDGENTLEYLSMRDGFFENILWSLQKHLGITFDEEGMIKVNGEPQLGERILIDNEYTMEMALEDERMGGGRIFRLPNGEYEFVGYYFENGDEE